MSDKKIAKVVVGLPLMNPFDYTIPENLRGKIKVGCRVKIEFNARKMVGYVYSLCDKSRLKHLSPIINLLDERPILSKRYLAFLSKVADYYFASTGEMIETAIPVSLREGKVLDEYGKNQEGSNYEKLEKKSKFKAYVYCSDDEGKKHVFFIKKIAAALESESQVIFLLPDKSLVDSWSKRLKEVFSPKRIICLHSRLTRKESLSAWLAIKNQSVDIVLGTRQAVFAPLDNIGLIIVDSEDNFVYKQETRPYYHARDVALILARERDCEIVLESISPSLDIFHETAKDKFKFITDPNGDEKAARPLVKIVDLKAQSVLKKGAIFSIFLFERIRSCLEEKKKVLVFLNRRGFSTYVRCRHCGYVLRCKRCSAGLIYYYNKKDLHCPYCNYHTSDVSKCPSCALDLVYFGGFGVEKVESEAFRLFPAAKIAFLDSVNNASDIPNLDLVIVTQAGLKEDLIKDKINLCVALSIDNMLNFAQLRSSEEAFRVLRRLQNLCRDEMIIQTYYPEHRVFKNIAKGDYLSFAREELADRKILKLPPFMHLISINLKGFDEEKLHRCAQALFSSLCEELRGRDCEIFEPIKDMPYRLRSKFRLQILVKTAKVEGIKKTIDEVLSGLKGRHSVKVAVNVDI